MTATAGQPVSASSPTSPSRGTSFSTGNAEKPFLTNGVFTSRTDEWETPQGLFLSLSAEFGPFDVDVAADASNAKVARYYSKAEDGLAQEWTGRCWMNPPYGRVIGKWIKKASESKALVVCLIPARTDTTYWHDYVIPRAKQIRFLRGRVRFGGKGPAPFPSAVIIFDGRLS